MMNYNPEKHHRRSIRLPEYDYSKGGAYFVTICTRNGDQILSNPPKPIPLVGVALAATHLLDMPPNLESNPDPDSALRFQLTSIGEIVDCNWRMLPERFPMISLDEYVIMPNHLHGIVFINECDQLRQCDTVEKRVGARPTPTVPKNPKNPTLGMIIGAFKSMSVNDAIAHIEENSSDMIGKIWQRNYFEQVIRNERDLDNIRTYIRNNPVNWDQDDENPAR